jgi:hypothetical protein
VALNAKSGTLTANTAAPITITDAYPDGVWVHNRSQTGEIWVRFDGTNPTVAGDDCFLVLGSRLFPVTTVGRESVTAKLISSQALAYTVEGTVLGL